MRHRIDMARMLSAAGVQDLPLARAYMTARLGTDTITTDVLDAMSALPRHCFLQRHRWRVAYLDLSLGTADGWLLAPSLLSKALSALPCRDSTHVLEIGTGSGYQTALLAMLNDKVFTICEPGVSTFDVLRRLDSTGLTGIHFIGSYRQIDDISIENGVFDGIVLNHAVREFPTGLVRLLRLAGGHIVAPILAFDGSQRLVRCTVIDGEFAQMVDVGSASYPVAWWQ